MLFPIFTKRKRLYTERFTNLENSRDAYDLLFMPVIQVIARYC